MPDARPDLPHGCCCGRDGLLPGADDQGLDKTNTFDENATRTVEWAITPERKVTQ